MVPVASRNIWRNYHTCTLSSIQPATRRYTTKSDSNALPIVKIPTGSNIYAFGTPSRTTAPLISNVDWTVQDGDAWAVISGTGGGGKGTLLGHTRLAPRNAEIQGRWAEAGGLYPFLSASSVDPYTRISHVSFRQRTGGESGAFFDYTARYGAMREEEDRITLKDTLSTSALAGDQALFDTLTEQMGLTPLLDLPIITLSNGQTRRARVVKAILDRPELLLLDEPLTGLDSPSRKALNETLHHLHLERSPRIIVGLRKGEEVPAWITHVLEIEGRTASTRKVLQSNPIFHPAHGIQIDGSTAGQKSEASSVEKKSLLVDMKDVNVAYGNRKVLTNINWQIRQGERWHLQGANGSGKTTLLAILTGDHPQSYTQAHLHLPAFDSSSTARTHQISHPHAHTLRPRKRTPTAHLRTLIGVVSPEMFDAFPRRHPGMSVWEAVTTGFDGGFVPRTRDADMGARRKGGVGWVDVADDELGLPSDSEGPNEQREKRRDEIRKWRVQRCWEVLRALGPAAWAGDQSSSHLSSPQDQTHDFASLSFSSLSPGEQRLVLLMRALVGRPPLVFLDEVWSGMDDSMIAAARRYLLGEVPSLDGDVGVTERQAVVVITHWEDEVPWTGEEVRQFKLS
ncbi:P-loop containing nucleoside triphosphate hydrolase protein [Flammula alnicola]|nr:P-loop containing nucleoside triphosphate hydrolase protein [Flammula alnicola]